MGTIAPLFLLSYAYWWAVSGVATFFNSNRKSKVIKREHNKDSKFFIDHQRLPWRSPNSDRGSNSKTPGLVRVCLGRPGHGSTRRVNRVLPGFAPDGFLVNPDRSSHRVDLPGRSEFKNYTWKQERLKAEQCNVYFKKNDLILTGKKDTPRQRVKVILHLFFFELI